MAPDALAEGTYKIAGGWEMSLGRWGIQFLDKARGGIVNEVIIVVASLIFLTMASVFIRRLLKIKNYFAIIIISFILATAPVFSETFMFIYCADSYCLAFLAAVLSAYFINRRDKSKKYIIAGMLFGVVSLCIYQAYIAVTIVLIMICTIIDILKQEKQIKDIFIKFIIDVLIILGAMICYFAATKIILLVNGIEFASYKGASSLSIMTIIKNLPMTLKDSYTTTFNFLFKEEILYNDFWHRDILNILLLLTNLGFFLYLIIKKQIYKKKCDLGFLILLGLILPIGINIISIIMPDTRTNIVTGPALFMIYILMIAIIEKIDLKNKVNSTVKIASSILLLILVFTYIMSDNATYLAREEVHTNYYSISSDILHKVQNLEGYTPEMKWIFSDNIRYKSKFAPMANGTISNDYETWNNLDGIWINYQFYDRYLGTKINMGTKDDYFKIVKTEEFKQMESYPSKNCIKIIDNFVVIKIGTEHYTE